VYMSYPIFLPIAFLLLVFWTHFYPVIFSSFYILFHNTLQFISQHSTVYFPTSYLFISQHLSVHFANILLVYSSAFIHLNLFFFLVQFYLFVLQRFTFTFSFYSSLKTEKFRRFQTKFRQRGILKYLIFGSERDSFIYLLIIIIFLSCLFLIFYFYIFTLFLFYIFVFSFYLFLLFILFIFYKVLVQYWSILVQGPYNCPAQGHFGPIIFNSTLIGPYLYPSNHWLFFFLHIQSHQSL